MRPGVESPDLSEVPAVQWNERVRLFRDSIWNIASLAVSGIVGVVLVPVMYRGLGTERYGVWLAASSIVDIASGLGFGLGLSIVREVARSVRSSNTKDCEQFIASSRIIYLVLGAAVLIALALVSGLFAAGLHLNQNTRSVVRPVFILVGVAFVGEQLSAFALAILAGLRRFDLIGTIAVTGTIFNALSTFVLLRRGHSIVSIACLRAALGVGAALITSRLIFLVQPVFGRWNATIDLHVLRNQARFIFASQANTAIGKAVFDGVVPVIGFILGATAIVPFRIGQKLPQFVAAVYGRVAEVLYPASSEYEVGGDFHNLRDALRWGTRTLIFTSVPALALLFVLGPFFLHLWIPIASPEAVLVLRVYVLAILFDVPSYAADNILWGTGQVKVLLATMITVGATTFTVGVICMLRLGVVGMAIGTAAGLGLGTILLLVMSCRILDLPLGDFSKFATRGLLIPSTLCVISLWVMCSFSAPTHFYSLLGIAVSGLVIYLASHFALTSSRTEREMLLRGLRRRDWERKS